MKITEEELDKLVEEKIKQQKVQEYHDEIGRLYRKYTKYRLVLLGNISEIRKKIEKETGRSNDYYLNRKFQQIAKEEIDLFYLKKEIT